MWPAAWETFLISDVAFYRRLHPRERERFRTAVASFVRDKRVVGVDVEVDDRVRLLVAASACRLALSLPGETYSRLRVVEVQSTSFDAYLHDDRVVEVLGTAQLHRVVIALDALGAGLRDDGQPNVGYHEFAHVLDASDGVSDGVPLMLADPSLRRRWIQVMTRELARHRADVEAGEPTLISANARESEVEFFAYATEVFFGAPEDLHAAHAELYALLATYYAQDPVAARAAPPPDLGRRHPPRGVAAPRLPRPLRQQSPPTPPMPLEQIDLLLATWDERLDRVDQNLLALQSEPIHPTLAGERPQFEGVTEERVGPALDTVDELFEHRERLVAVVAKAKEARAAISALAFWDKDDESPEIHRLLRRASITLGQRVVALGQRDPLELGFEDVLIAPEQLLAHMESRFQEARTVLLAVSQAWEALAPAMTAVEAELQALRDLSAAPAQQAGTSADLVEASAALARLRARMAKDPLGAQDGVEREIKPRLLALRARLEAERGVRERVERGIAEAHDLRRRLAEGHERALRLAGEVAHAITGPALSRLPPALDDGLLTGLDAWLGKIADTTAARRWSPAEIGLARWRAIAEQYAAADAAATTEAEALLGRRDELSGRLSARRAQAAALSVRGLPIDPSSEAYAREAEALLRQRPLPLDEAMSAVERYEAAVAAQRARPRGELG